MEAYVKITIMGYPSRQVEGAPRLTASTIGNGRYQSLQHGTLQADLKQMTMLVRNIPPSSHCGASMWLSTPPASELFTPSSSSLALQDFPYNVDPGMEHHNVWNPRPLSSQQLEQVAYAGTRCMKGLPGSPGCSAAAQQVVAHHRHGYDYITFVNPEALASIPGVHAGQCVQPVRQPAGADHSFCCSVWHAHCFSRPQ